MWSRWSLTASPLLVSTGFPSALTHVTLLIWTSHEDDTAVSKLESFSHDQNESETRIDKQEYLTYKNFIYSFKAFTL